MLDVEALQTFTAIAAPTGAEGERLRGSSTGLAARQAFASATVPGT